MLMDSLEFSTVNIFGLKKLKIDGYMLTNARRLRTSDDVLWRFL